MIKVVLNSSIMGLVDDYREYDLSQYATYKGLMHRKGTIWQDNIGRYLQYLSIDADTMMDAQDETITLTSTLGHQVPTDRTGISGQPPGSISIVSHRPSQDLETPNIQSMLNTTVVRRNLTQIPTSSTPLRFDNMEPLRMT
jgi:hypothetical protein